MIGQIGSATDSTKFLNSLRDNTKIAPVVYVTKGKSPVQMCAPDITSTTDQLDSKFADLKENSPELDRWVSIAFAWLWGLLLTYPSSS